MFTDEQLMAYADGELPQAEAAAVAAAMRGDAQLAARVAQFSESRRVLQDAFAQKLHEPVPARLRELLRDEAGKVVPMRHWTRIARNRWIPLALAASLALAVGLSAGGWLLQRGPASPAIAGLPADADLLSHALETLASGEPLRGQGFEIMPTASLRTAGGELCREFESAAIDAPARARGVACRVNDGQWRTVAAVAASTSPPLVSDYYIPAAGGEIDLAAALGPVQRLTPQEEQDLIGHHWRGRN